MRWGFPDSSAGKESTCNAGDMGSIPGSGRFPGGGHGNRLQYSCLECPMDRRAWWATACGSIHPIHPEKEESNRNPIFTSLGNLENVPSIHTFTGFFVCMAGKETDLLDLITVIKKIKKLVLY